VTPALLIRNVSVRYAGGDAAALDEVSLAVEPGEGVALLGANGAGKTTLLRTAMALIHPATGTVEVAGRDTRGRHPEDLADVAGYAFQNPEAQLFERTVRAEIGFGPRQLGWSEERITDVTAELLEQLELVPWADTHPYDLPAPRRRIVALAATLATRPQLLLLDEPTAGLDGAGRLLIERAVRSARAAGAGVMAVTHDGDLAIESFDRALLLERGRIARSGSVADLLGSTDDAPALPAPAQLDRRLGLGSASLGRAGVAEALAARCRARI
jgi:energy-coupling factor transporter ATP-binding protein EcfA2